MYQNGFLLPSIFADLKLLDEIFPAFNLQNEYFDKLFEASISRSTIKSQRLRDLSVYKRACLRSVAVLHRSAAAVIIKLSDEQYCCHDSASIRNTI